MADLVGGGVAGEAAEDLQAEGDGVAGGAACHDAAGADGGGRGVAGALRDELILEALEAGEVDARQDVRAELAEDEARGGADGRDRAAGGVVLLHQPDERRAGGEVPGAGHAAREYHHVVCRGALVPGVQLGQESIGRDQDAVGGFDLGIVGQGDQTRGDAAPAEDVVGGEGLDIFEAVCQKDIHTFHMLQK